MSNIYIQEPPTGGKVILHTTVGPIDIELWSKETPKACRNFVQLCMEKYYDGTKFHRVIKGMCVQGGDPTGTGDGGESIYGKPFKDEVHSRLRFVRRGLVAMASGEKNDNSSQFFFTFGATPHLNGKHTIFGKVVGDTIYNMLKLEEGDVDNEDRPEYPQKIKYVEIVENPFPDIVPRVKEVKIDDKDAKDKKKDKTEKNFKLLSFGDEAEEEDGELDEIVEKNYRGKSKSSHDLLTDDKTLSSAPAVESKRDEENEESETAEKKPADMRKIRDKLKESAKPSKSKSKVVSDEEGDVNVENYFEEERKRKAKKQADEIRSEYKKLKKEMKDDDRKREEELNKKDVEDSKTEKRDAGDNDMLASFYAEQDAYSSNTTAILKKKERSDREAQTLAILEKFKTKLKAAKSSDDKEEDPESSDWLKHELRFDDGAPVLAKDANTEKDDMYDITDPRHPLNIRKRKESSRHSGHRQRR